MYKLIVLFLTQNDMIGPPGYGEARFISLTTPLNYKIRFENEANATAPAQHVIILHTLDQDLDMRTFRITSFGFGNFTRKLTNARASIQVNVSADQQFLMVVSWNLDKFNHWKLANKHNRAFKAIKGDRAYRKRKKKAKKAKQITVV